MEECHAPPTLSGGLNLNEYKLYLQSNITDIVLLFFCKLKIILIQTLVLSTHFLCCQGLDIYIFLDSSELLFACLHVKVFKIQLLVSRFSVEKMDHNVQHSSAPTLAWQHLAGSSVGPVLSSKQLLMSI